LRPARQPGTVDTLPAAHRLPAVRRGRALGPLDHREQSAAQRVMVLQIEATHSTKRRPSPAPSPGLQDRYPGSDLLPPPRAARHPAAATRAVEPRRRLCGDGFRAAVIRDPYIERETRNAALILAGVLAAGFGIEGFLVPGGFIDGGVTGVSMLLGRLTTIPLPVWLPLINLPFLVVGYRQLGAAFAVRGGSPSAPSPCARGGAARHRDHAGPSSAASAAASVPRRGSVVLDGTGSPRCSSTAAAIC
jgi:hypothetical protein